MPGWPHISLRRALPALRCLLLALALGLVLMPAVSYAGGTGSGTGSGSGSGSGSGTGGGTPAPGSDCTNESTFDIQPPPAGQGLISQVTTNIQGILQNIASTMFGDTADGSGIVGSSGFLTVLQASATLYVAIYGILFTFGMVQITLHDFAIRAIKLGIIMMLLTPHSWNFFNHTVVRFFNQGTDDIIAQVTNIGIGGEPAVQQTGFWDNNGDAASGVYPFAALDNAVAYAFSAKAAVTIMGIFAAGPYGLAIGLLLAMAMGSFIKSLLNALWIYLMSLVIKTLIFGLAPIFIACLLHSRTKHIADGALNQVINASLQPLFLFTFFAFYLNLIYACLLGLFGPNATPLCFEPYSLQAGTGNTDWFWSFMKPDPANPSGWAINRQKWDFQSPFPVPLLSVLVFLILAELAKKFNEVVVQIAQDIAGSVTGLSTGSEGLASVFSGASTQGRGSAMGAKAAGTNTTNTAKAKAAAAGQTGERDNPNG